MPHRSYASTANYRFGFNGKENDNEPKGLGNQQDYGMRIYDPRLGRFLSLDPLQRKYPGESNFVFTSNNPILYIDVDGRDKIITHIYKDENGNVLKKFDIIASNEIRSQRIQSSNFIDKHDYHWEYSWHDVNQIVTHTMSNGAEVSRSVSGETLGKVRTTTYFDIRSYAQFKLKVTDKKWESGIIFYSSNGQGNETKGSLNPVHMEDIGSLLSLVDGMKDVGKLDILENSFLEYASKGSTAEKFGKVIDRIERFTKLQEANSKQKEVTGMSPFDIKTTPNTDHQTNLPSQIEPERKNKKTVLMLVDSVKGKNLWPGAEWSHTYSDKKTNDTVFKIKENKQ